MRHAHQQENRPGARSGPESDRNVVNRLFFGYLAEVLGGILETDERPACSPPRRGFSGPKGPARLAERPGSVGRLPGAAAPGAASAVDAGRRAGDQDRHPARHRDHRPRSRQGRDHRARDGQIRLPARRAHRWRPGHVFRLQRAFRPDPARDHGAHRHHRRDGRRPLDRRGRRERLRGRRGDLHRAQRGLRQEIRGEVLAGLRKDRPGAAARPRSTGDSTASPARSSAIC